MEKTIFEALVDEIIYPLPEGKIENICIKRGLNMSDAFSTEVSNSKDYIGALADCLFSLIQSVNFTEADKTVGTISPDNIKKLLALANRYYKSIGEEEVELDSPMVYIGG